MNLIFIKYLSLIATIYSEFAIVHGFSCECNNERSIGGSYRKCNNGTCTFTDKHTLLGFPSCYVSLREKGCTIKFECERLKGIGKQKNKKFIVCCSDSMCNTHLSVKGLAEWNDDTERNETIIYKSTVQKNNSQIILSIALPCTCILLVISVVFLAVKIKTRYQKKRERNIEKHTSLISIARDKQDFSTSGSGIGAPLLVKQTISCQIVLEDVIGSGAFGNVYHGLCNGIQDVAVKILSTNEEESWEHEKDLYLTTALPHKNILGFIAADRKDDGVSIQLWLVFDFHRAGSLYDFLNERTVDLKGLVLMIGSIVAGLDHLHKPILGYPLKPGIAHRDLKTKNILVKMDGTCCIADFGLAHKHTVVTRGQDKPPIAKIGTRRYQAPEILDNKINVHWFDAFRKADMYAFALCLWEVCRRTEIEGRVGDYQLPYFNDVPSNPTDHDMREVVHVQRKRPLFMTYWQHNHVMKTMMDIMKECWYPDPLARLPIARVRKRLIAISTNRAEENAKV